MVLPDARSPACARLPRSAGGIATFAGTTRDHFDGKRVRLSQVNSGLACADSHVCVLAGAATGVRSLRSHGGEGTQVSLVPPARNCILLCVCALGAHRSLCGKIRTRWAVKRIALIHRTGTVEVGKVIVSCLCS